MRLAERHPDLFEKAVALERKVEHEATRMKGRAYTWSEGESLKEFLARRDAILAGDAAARAKPRASNRLLDVLAGDDDEGPCLVCDL